MGIVERAVQWAQENASHADSTRARLGDGQVERPTSASSLPPEPRLEDPGALASHDPKAIVRINTDALRAAGRLPSMKMASQIDDEIRRIKWPLLKAMTGRDGVDSVRNNVVLVTSAVPGEGKTFVSLNLALSIVRDREMRVVLVDGDVARPGLTPALGVENRAGLNDALTDAGCDISSVTYQTDVDGLFFVPAGKWNSDAPEFFSGSRMPRFMDALRMRVGRGLVIIDSPPLLATNEAQVATRLAGHVLVVVRANRTGQQTVLDALSLVDKEVPVSMVLNCVEPSVLNRYYGRDHYGSGYGSGYGRSYDRGPGAGQDQA